MHVLAAFVGKGRAANVGRADVVRDVGQLIHEERQLAQPREIGDHGLAELELEVRRDGDEVAIAHALAVAVDRPLHLHRARRHRCERIGHAEARVVVRVDAHRRAHFRDHVARRLRDELRQRSAIGIAQHQQVRTRAVRRAQRRQRVVRIVLVAVEKMLRVVEHLASVAFQKRHGVRDHREVFLPRHPEHLDHLERPRFAHDRHGGRLRVEEDAHLWIVLDAHLAAPRRAERGDLRLLPRALFHLAEKLRVLRIRARETALDVMHAKRVELFRHANLVHDRERNPGPLRAVAECGVVDGETWSAHDERARSVRRAGGRGKRGCPCRNRVGVIKSASMDCGPKAQPQASPGQATQERRPGLACFRPLA